MDSGAQWASTSSPSRLSEILAGYARTASEVRHAVMGLDPNEQIEVYRELLPWSSATDEILAKAARIAEGVTVDPGLSPQVAPPAGWTGRTLSVQYLMVVIDSVYRHLERAVTTGRDERIDADHMRPDGKIERRVYTLNGRVLSNPRYRQRLQAIGPLIRPIVLGFYYVESRDLHPYALSRDGAATKGICQAKDTTWRNTLAWVMKSEFPPNAYGSIHLAVLFTMLYILNSMRTHSVLSIAEQLQRLPSTQLKSGLLRLAQVLWSIYNAGEDVAERAVARWWFGQPAALPAVTVKAVQEHLTPGMRYVLDRLAYWWAVPQRVPPGQEPASLPEIPRARADVSAPDALDLRRLLGIRPDQPISEGELIRGAVRLYQSGRRQDEVLRALVRAKYGTDQPTSEQMAWARRIDALAQHSLRSPAARLGTWPSSGTEPVLFGTVSGFLGSEEIRATYDRVRAIVDALIGLRGQVQILQMEGQEPSSPPPTVAGTVGAPPGIRFDPSVDLDASGWPHGQAFVGVAPAESVGASGTGAGRSGRSGSGSRFWEWRPGATMLPSPGGPGVYAEPPTAPSRPQGTRPARRTMEQAMESMPDASQSPMAGRDLGGSGWHRYLHTMPHGRLLACFPAYCVLLVYGGRWIRKWRFWDQFYGTFGIASIDVYRSRLSPTHHAQVMISNMYHALGNAAAAHLVDQMIARGGQWLEWDPSEDMIRAGGPLAQWWRNVHQWLFPHVGEYERRVYELEFRSLFVKPGTRLHIRMGYGANAAALPVLFNGTIGEVRFEDNMVVLTALGDGVELEKPIKPTSYNEREKVSHFQLTGLFGLAVEPRQILIDIMTSTRRDSIPILGPIIYSVSGAGYLNSSLFGIHNFGLVGVNRYLGGMINTPHPGETCVNVYSSAPLAETYSRGYYGVLDLFLLLIPGLDEFRPGIRISIDVKNGTIWDVIHSVRQAILDYVVSVEPFDLHSTLFVGRPDYPLYYTYLSADEVVKTLGPNWGLEASLDDLHKVMRYYQFQQYHCATDADNLVRNNLSLSNERLVTDCATRDTSGFVGNMILFDPMVIPEDRNEVFYDSALNTSAIDLLLPGSRNASLINFISRLSVLRSVLRTDKLGLAMPVREVNNVSANVIRESLMDMYQGELVLAGMPGLKPWDVLFIQDQMRMMHGPVGVREVHHHLSVSRGFLTTVTPDLVSVGLSDKHTFLLYRAWATAGNAMAFYGLAYRIAQRMTLHFWAARGGMFGSVDEVVQSARAMRAVRTHSGWEQATRIRQLVDQLRDHLMPGGKFQAGEFGRRNIPPDVMSELRDTIELTRRLTQHLDSPLQGQLDRLCRAALHHADKLEEALMELERIEQEIRGVSEQIRKVRSLPEGAAARATLRGLQEQVVQLSSQRAELLEVAKRHSDQLLQAGKELTKMVARLPRLAYLAWAARMKRNFGGYWKQVSRQAMAQVYDELLLAPQGVTVSRLTRKRMALLQRRHRLKMAAVGMLSSIRDVVKTATGAAARLFLDTSEWQYTVGNLIDRIRMGVQLRPLYRNPGELIRGAWKLPGRIFTTTFSRASVVLMGVGHLLELINRKLNSMYVCHLFPVLQAGRPFLGGLRGHAGTVYGDRPGAIQEILACFHRDYAMNNVLSTTRLSPFAASALTWFNSLFLQREHNPVMDWSEFHDLMPVTGALPASPFDYGVLRVLGSVGKPVVSDAGTAVQPTPSVLLSEWQLDAIRNSEVQLRRALEEAIRAESVDAISVPPTWKGDLCDYVPTSDARMIATLEPQAQERITQFLQAVRRELKRRGMRDIGVFITSARRSRIHQRALFASRYPTLEALNRAAEREGIRPFTQAEWNVYRSRYPTPNRYPVAARSAHEQGKAVDVNFFSRRGVERTAFYADILQEVAQRLGLRYDPSDPVHVAVP